MLVVERRLVHTPHVLVSVGGYELVVGLARLPAVDDEIAPGNLDVAEELGADVAAAGTEELRPLALGSVDAFELRQVGDVIREDQRDQRKPPRS